MSLEPIVSLHEKIVHDTHLLFKIPTKAFYIDDHSFSKHAKFSENLTFLTPDTYTNVCVSGIKTC